MMALVLDGRHGLREAPVHGRGRAGAIGEVTWGLYASGFNVRGLVQESGLRVWEFRLEFMIGLGLPVSWDDTH